MLENDGLFKTSMGFSLKENKIFYPEYINPQYASSN